MAVIVYIIVIAFVIIRYQKIRKQAKAKREGADMGTFTRRPKRQAFNPDGQVLPSLKGRPEYTVRDTGSVHQGISRSFYESENNNWLTYQLREERRAKAVTDQMFNLRREYAASNDARKLREEHEQTHGMN